MTETSFTLYGRPGWGSALVELQLAYYRLPYRLEIVGDIYRDADARAALLALNPRGQVPVLDLPDGQRMTESAAMTLHLADLAQSDALVPGPQAPERAAFLRWLIFIVANIYPTFTFADVPTRFVDDDRAAPDFVARVNLYAKTLWGEMEAEAARQGGPWFLGARFSAIDLYIAVMREWRPGRAWFAATAPRLHAIAEAVWQRKDCAKALAVNFPPE